MTVKQSGDSNFGAEIPFADIVAGVRKVLDSDETYKRTSERIGGDGRSVVFYTHIRPNMPLLLGTDMYIRVEPSGEQTRVSAATESQPLIIGDIFGMYGSHIRTFLERLNRELHRQKS
jgi:hypothetical protein